MPELPEVEHARASVEAWCVGRRVVRAEVPASRLLRGAPPAPVVAALEGHRVAAAERRGKHLLVILDAGDALHVHLGMSGRLERYDHARGLDRAHVRLLLQLEDDSVVLLRDARMLGKLVLDRAEHLRAQLAAELGPDPLLDGLDAARLVDRLGASRRPIKVALMDQAVIAGLGNIYAAEALWRAGVHPEHPAATLGPARAERLAEAIHAVLALGLRSLDEDQRRYGQVRYLSDGAAAPVSPFGVYDREGERCTRCEEGVITRQTQAGRSTFFCPRCQRLRRAR